MIYRGIRIDDSGKRKNRLDIMKAVGIALGVVVVIAAVILLSRQLGIR